MASRRPAGVDGPLFKQALLGSLSWLSANHEEVNRLNVFPVPDGDTGTNMLLTLQSAVEDIKESSAAEVSKIAKLASHGSLMGARGNSGVILSQILRDAGVVDAGGFGLQIILEGMLKSIEQAESFHVDIVAAKPKAAQVALELPEGGWGYCTEFLIEGSGLDVDLIRNKIEALGNSVLVVGEPELVKVHVHTDDPSGVITLAGGFGKLLKLNVGDMSTQHKRILDSEGAAGRPPREN